MTTTVAFPPFKISAMTLSQMLVILMPWINQRNPQEEPASEAIITMGVEEFSSGTMLHLATFREDHGIMVQAPIEPSMGGGNFSFQITRGALGRAIEAEGELLFNPPVGEGLPFIRYTSSTRGSQKVSFMPLPAPKLPTWFLIGGVPIALSDESMMTLRKSFSWFYRVRKNLYPQHPNSSVEFLVEDGLRVTAKDSRHGIRTRVPIPLKSDEGDVITYPEHSVTVTERGWERFESILHLPQANTPTLVLGNGSAPRLQLHAYLRNQIGVWAVERQTNLPVTLPPFPDGGSSLAAPRAEMLKKIRELAHQMNARLYTHSLMNLRLEDERSIILEGMTISLAFHKEFMTLPHPAAGAPDQIVTNEPMPLVWALEDMTKEDVIMHIGGPGKPLHLTEAPIVRNHSVVYLLDTIGPVSVDGTIPKP